MRNKILTALAVVVGVGIFAGFRLSIFSEWRPVPKNVHDADQQASYKKTIDFQLSTGAIRDVNLEKGIVWVDDAFLEKSHHNKENVLWPVYLHMIGRGESEWLASVDVLHFSTGERVGSFSRGMLTTQ